MNPDVIESSAPSATWAGGDRSALWRSFLSILVFSAMGALAVWVGHGVATSAVMDVGPTDEGYVRHFRDIERDGPVFFRWTSVPSSSISLPIRFCGPGSVRLRVRRHFADPAVLTVSLAGTVLGQRSVQARPDHPYEVLEFPVLDAICTSNASILLEASVGNARSLGVALDWIELRSRGFAAPSNTLVAGAAFLAMATLALWVAGSGVGLALGMNCALAMLIGISIAANPVAGERMLRGATAAMALALILGFLICRLSGIFRLSLRARATLVTITLVTLASRSAFLHTQAFYPDYRVHALVQQTLNNLGLSSFLQQLFEIQYARSLGLQQIEGNWYPFPYPPGSYLLGGGVLRLFGLDALDASLVTAITAACLIPLLTAAAGVALGLGEFASVAGAFYVALQPLLVRRMAFGYFPGVMGQCVDAVAMLLVFQVLRNSRSRVRSIGLLALALVAAFLVYTQSIANFGLLVFGLLLFELVRRSPRGHDTALRIALAATLALSASVGAFYWRYQPVAANAMNHRPQPESVVLDRLEQLRRSAPIDADVHETGDLNDPFAGATINPLRGLARLGSRLWRFNGPFVLGIVIGGSLLLRRSEKGNQNLILAWGGVAIWISLMAAGLPSPNGFQHLKDLEFVSPLIALALGVLTKHLWDRHPALGAALAGAWTLFAFRAFAGELTARLMPLTGL